MDDVTTLRSDLEKEKQRYHDLEQRFHLAVGQTVCHTEGVSYIEFRAMVLAKIGKTAGNEQGWRAAYLHGCNGKFNDSHLTRWRKTGVVPPEAVNAISTMSLDNRPTNQQWSKEEKEILVSEYFVITDGKVKISGNKKICAVAAELTVRFGRTINENSVKSKMNSYRQTLDCRVVQPDFAPKNESIVSAA